MPAYPHMPPASLNPASPLYFVQTEVTHHISDVSGDFCVLDGRGPIVAGIDIARSAGSIAILDAGCGSGNALIGLKEQISRRAPIDENAITAVGVDQHDYSMYLEWEKADKVADGYVDLRQGDLASTELGGPQFDLSYAYEVLIHSDRLTAIVTNILSALKPGGVFYYNTLPRQTAETESLARSLGAIGWTICSRLVTKEFIGRTDARILHKLVKPQS